jgi:hypothetical protein
MFGKIIVYILLHIECISFIEIKKDQQKLNNHWVYEMPTYL